MKRNRNEEAKNLAAGRMIEPDRTDTPSQTELCPEKNDWKRIKETAVSALQNNCDVLLHKRNDGTIKVQAYQPHTLL